MILGRCALAAGLAAAVFWSATLRAEDMPKPKAGLWESRMISGGGTETPQGAAGKQCMGGNMDMKALTGQMCDLKWKRVASDRIETETRCKMGTISAEGKGVIIGDFNSKVRIESTSKVSMEGAPAGTPQIPLPKERTMVIEARWLGPCEPGQQPGDVILPDGKVVHMPGMAK